MRSGRESPSSNLSTDLQAATSANAIHPGKDTNTNAGHNLAGADVSHSRRSQDFEQEFLSS
jgi:hypothetical protein